ncbi:unnamed protein product [Effrenium voratum]|uniref:Insulin-degrading enzyme n=1 Tax=Effrenium voratum TaxID=2562239 RepID=A0AA36NAT9_9DINO|nr:unnamed protein product [Effrenium voratum]
MAASAMYDTVHIGGLPPGTSEAVIREIFGQYAPIHAAKVLETAPGQAVEALLGIGKEASQWVVENLNGNIPQGFQTPVSVQMMPAEQGAPQGALQGAPQAAYGAGQFQMASGPPRDNLYIKGLPDGCTDDYMRQIFGQYANVLSCKVLPAAPGKGDAAGYIRFASVEEAKYILETLNGNIPQGLQTPLSIKYAGDRAGSGGADGTEEGDWQCELCSNMNFRRRDYCNICTSPRPPHLAPPPMPAKGKGKAKGPGGSDLPPNINLYVSGLPIGATEETVKSFFIQYGEVFNSKVLPVTAGKNTVAGFVRMAEFEAKWCLENLNGFQPEGFSVPLQVAFAKDKVEDGKKARRDKPIAICYKCWPGDRIRFWTGGVIHGPVPMKRVLEQLLLLLLLLNTAQALLPLPRRSLALGPFLLAPSRPSPARSEEVESAGGSVDSPWNKPRKYSAQVLDNGLRVLLVEDRAAEQMDIAFTAGFGQFDDPKDLPGLAHLTEHLLLGGPGPANSAPLEQWLETREGESNGLTGFESALFTVSCDAEDWADALQRFGHCFRASTDSDPRFTAEAVEREVLRIDSEFQDGLSPALRNLQLLRRRSQAAHPLRAFGPGSLKTLLPHGRRKEHLERLAALSKELFDRTGAPLATLSVVCAKPLPQLAAQVAAAFGGLAAPSAALEREAARADPLPAAGGLPVFVIDTPETPALSFTWSIPFGQDLDLVAFRASKPLVVLSHLVAHQGPGSLSSWLRQQGFVPDNLGPKVSAQTPFSTDGFAIWELKIKLSPKGLSNWRAIVTAVFGLLAALRRRYVQDALGGPRRDALREAADEVSDLADIAWRFPPRPPLASELALNMRTAPRPAAYVFASRRFFSAGEWSSLETAPNADLQSKAARFTSAEAQEAAAEEASKVLKRLVPERARLTLFSTSPQGEARSADLVRYGELQVEQPLQKEWLAAGIKPALWWLAPPLNVYLSRADKIQKSPAMPDPDIPESIKSKKGFNGVLWSDACRARLIEPKTERLETPIPRFLWAVPGCIYVSGQFNELVEPLGNEPIVTLTLWLPARCIQEASLQSKAAGRMWLISLQCALESPFFGAALAGCRWESAFFASSSEAGMRLCFQGFCDNLPSFATDVAAAIGAHSGPTNGDELELVRRLALAELQTGKTRRDGASDLRSCLQQIKIGDIQKEAKALWRSAAESAPISQALVAGAISQEQSAELVEKVAAQLPLGRGAMADVSVEPGQRPAAVLTRRPSWQGPVAQSLCRASGLPALLDVCGRTLR